MKRSTLVLIILIGCFSTSLGQTFNKTYTRANANLRSRCVALVPNAHNFISADVFPQAGGQRFMVTKTSTSGAFLKAVYIDTPFYDHRILETSDSGLVVAAYLDTNLYIMKFNQALALQWGRLIRIGVDQYKSGEITVDIEKGRDSFNRDVYYILSGSPTFIAQYVTTDAITSVVKLDYQGGFVWHRKYVQSSRTTSGLQQVIDIPHSLTPVDSGNTTFVIGGTRQEVDSNSQVTQSLFFFKIDELGQVVGNYQKVITADAEPWSPEAVWNGANNTIASTYREMNYTFWSDPLNTSGIGFLNLNSSLNPLTGVYYTQFCTNYGNSITMGSDASYTIGCYTSDCDPAGLDINPALLKINSTDFSPQYFNRYNIDRNGYNLGFHRNDAQDNNYLVPFIEEYSSSPTQRQRLIVADNNGSVCGEHNEVLESTEFAPQGDTIRYSARKFTGILPYYPTVILDSLTTDSCDADNGDTYKLNSVEESKGRVLIYPTLISQRTLNVNCEISLEKEQMLEVLIRNILGQVIFRKAQMAGIGVHKLNIPSEVFSTGLNIISVTSGSEMLKAEKIIKQ